MSTVKLPISDYIASIYISIVPRWRAVESHGCVISKLIEFLRFAMEIDNILLPAQISPIGPFKLSMLSIISVIVLNKAALLPTSVIMKSNEVSQLQSN